MLTVLEVLAVLAVLFGAAVVATREGPILREAHRDAPDLNLPTGPLQPADVGEVRFAMALRGYRMREVDAVLSRLAAELASRDARIATLVRDGSDPPATAGGAQVAGCAGVAGAVGSAEPAGPDPAPGRPGPP